MKPQMNADEHGWFDFSSGSKAMMKTAQTLGHKRKTFKYDWSEKGAVLVEQRGKPRIDAGFLQRALDRFSGKTIEGGFSETDPLPGGFGEWIQSESEHNSRRLTSRHGSFVAAILCKEARVENYLEGNTIMLRFP